MYMYMYICMYIDIYVYIQRYILDPGSIRMRHKFLLSIML